MELSSWLCLERDVTPEFGKGPLRLALNPDGLIKECLFIPRVRGQAHRGAARGVSYSVLHSALLRARQIDRVPMKMMCLRENISIQTIPPACSMEMYSLTVMWGGMAISC